MSNIDVVITGMGATTPLGGDVASTWDGLLAGRSGISTIAADWAEELDLPVRIASRLSSPSAILVRIAANASRRTKSGRTSR
ncbi:beta-ketoacyl synthase N-terminal-like domain-containing protein, partial [Amycolatopsis sp. NPDC000673]|uniref:beta-ketoacyl synthase N-terminal-like domain-containing protein n=1 Tax=Amycolatopsis sp. NPDC000673 TaxID=3154267 RepID=UPI0033247362